MSPDTFSLAWHNRHEQLFTRRQKAAHKRIAQRDLAGIELIIACRGTTDVLARPPIAHVRAGRAYLTDFYGRLRLLEIRNRRGSPRESVSGANRNEA
jgi:hypothetical protein